jgi:hypothetical protein
VDQETGTGQLRLVGFPMTRQGDELWRHFRGWRVNYESIIYRLAYDLSVVPALWSGPRRWPDAPIGPHRYVNRTPEAPEGAALPLRGAPETSGEEETATPAAQLPDLSEGDANPPSGPGAPAGEPPSPPPRQA